MNKIRHPYFWEKPQMARLWETHFGGTRPFFRRLFRVAFDREHILVLKRPSDHQIAAELFWEDCSISGRKVASISSFCVKPELQRRGLGTELLEFTHEYLKQKGYSGAVLVPQDEDMYWFYHYFGYEWAGFHDSFFAKKDGTAEMTSISPEEYHRLRREYLPENGLEIAPRYFHYRSDTLAYYRGNDFICALEQGEVTECAELLGNLDAAGGIVGYFDRPHLKFYTPGTGEQDAMLLDFGGNLPGEIYLGFTPE